MNQQDLETTRQEAYRAFLLRDYERATRLAARLAEEDVASKQERLLILISLIRMGKADGARELFNSSREDLENNPFGPLELWLWKLTLGRTSVEEVLRVAGNQKERCQTWYYEGARRLSAFDDAGAKSAFQECLQMRVPCLEAQLAELELQKLE